MTGDDPYLEREAGRVDTPWSTCTALGVAGLAGGLLGLILSLVDHTGHMIGMGRPVGFRGVLLAGGVVLVAALPIIGLGGRHGHARRVPVAALAVFLVGLVAGSVLAGRLLLDS